MWNISEPSNVELTNADGYPIDGTIRKNRNDEDSRHNGTMSTLAKTTMDIANTHQPTIAGTLTVRWMLTSHSARRRKIQKTKNFHGNTPNITNMKY